MSRISVLSRGAAGRPGEKVASELSPDTAWEGWGVPGQQGTGPLKGEEASAAAAG